MILTKGILYKKGVWNKKIISLILVILVIMVVLIFIFKFDISKYLEFLPDFGTDKDRESFKEIENAEFADNIAHPRNFEFGGGKTDGEGAERPIDMNSYEEFEQPIPNPINFVSDYAGVISKDKEDKLNSIINALEKKNSVEIAIVSMKSMKEGYKEVALAIFNSWGIGKKGKNNGILIIFSNSDNTVRIQIGRGHINKILPNYRVGSLIDKYLVGKLNEQEIGDSLINLILEIDKILEEEYV